MIIDVKKSIALTLCREKGYTTLDPAIPLRLGLAQQENVDDEGGEVGNGQGENPLGFDFFADSIPIQLPWDFLLMRPHFSGVLLFGITGGDGLPAESIDSKARWLTELAIGIPCIAGEAGFGLMETKIIVSSIGLFVYEGGVPPDSRQQIRAMKQNMPFSDKFSVFWAMDLTEKKVHGHGMFPMFLNPNPKFLAGLLARGEIFRL